MKKPILAISCAEKILPDQRSELERRFSVKELGRAPTEADLIANLPGAELYVIGGDETLNADVVSRAEIPKLHIFLGEQWETAYTKEARNRLSQYGIRVETTGGGQTAVAHTTANLIASPLTLRSLDSRSVRLGQGRGYVVDIALIAQHLKVAIIGGGMIGTLVAKNLAALKDQSGRRLFPGLVYYRSSAENPELKALGLPYLNDICEAFKDADIVTVHLKYVEGVTDRLISPEVIDLMSRSGLFINTARAELIPDESGLLELIRRSPSRRFIFDPFYDEGNDYLRYAVPKKLSPIHEVRRKIALSPNVTLTEHSAAVFDAEAARITCREYGDALLKLINEHGY